MSPIAAALRMPANYLTYEKNVRPSNWSLIKFSVLGFGAAAAAANATAFAISYIALGTLLMSSGAGALQGFGFIALGLTLLAPSYSLFAIFNRSCQRMSFHMQKEVQL